MVRPWPSQSSRLTQHPVSEISRPPIQTVANCCKFSANFSQTFDDGLIRHAPPLSVFMIEMSRLWLRVRQPRGLTRTDISALSVTQSGRRLANYRVYTIPQIIETQVNYNVCRAFTLHEKRAHYKSVGKFLAFQIVLYLRFLQG